MAITSLELSQTAAIKCRNSSNLRSVRANGSKIALFTSAITTKNKTFDNTSKKHSHIIFAAGLRSNDPSGAYIGPITLDIKYIATIALHTIVVPTRNRNAILAELNRSASSTVAPSFNILGISLNRFRNRG